MPVGWCEVETSAAYFPPGSWKRVKPQHLAGTVFVEDEEVNPVVSPAVAGSVGPLTRLATRVSPSQAHRLAVEFPVQKYGLHHSIAEDEVREQFPVRGKIAVTLLEPEFDAGQERTVRFTFINTAPAQKGPSA